MSEIETKLGASTRTTQLYDRRRDEASLDDAERIVIEALSTLHIR